MARHYGPAMEGARLSLFFRVLWTSVLCPLPMILAAEVFPASGFAGIQSLSERVTSLRAARSKRSFARVLRSHTRGAGNVQIGIFMIFPRALNPLATHSVVAPGRRENNEKERIFMKNCEKTQILIDDKSRLFMRNDEKCSFARVLRPHTRGAGNVQMNLFDFST